MNKVLKKNIIDSFLQDYNRSSGLFVINFSKIKVTDIVAFRKALSIKNGKIFVIKNSLLRLGAKENSILQNIESEFSKQIALVSAFEDPFAVAKELNNFINKFDSISFKSGLIDGVLVDTEKFPKVSSIGSVKTLQAQLCGMLKNPINKLVCVLNQIAKKNNNNE